MQDEILPWILRDQELGDSVMEIGPGLGVTTDCLRYLAKSVECLEIDSELANSLGHRLLGTNVHVRPGDATAMPYRNCSFSAVVSFRMLHHVPSFLLQNQLFVEVHRALRLGGVFAGVDSLPSSPMCIIHLGDTMVLVDPATPAGRLESFGFSLICV